VNPITHALTGWCLAECAPSLTMRERAVVVVAAVAPDLDAFGGYHHILAHNLMFAGFAATAAAIITRRARPAVLAFVAVHLHIVEDLIGSRGPDGWDWPIAYLWPVGDVELRWSGQCSSRRR
jgi:inner membrane protein